MGLIIRGWGAEMAEQKTQKEREQEWWAIWRAENYSWEALERRIWEGWFVASDGKLVPAESLPPGSRPATLQDYWREEASHLIEGDGAKWTRAHCPLTWSNGEATPKANWGVEERAALKAVLLKKIDAVPQDRFQPGYLRRPNDPDVRAQFQGCVLFDSPIAEVGVPVSIAVRFDRACFVQAANFPSVKFLDDATFASALFLQSASFPRTEFSSLATFFGATFAGEAVFVGAAFSGAVLFKNATFFADANFEGAVLKGEVSFGGASFNKARFMRSLFGAHSSFEDARFSGAADFESAHFEAAVNFTGAKFFWAEFDEATFGSRATFRRVEFSNTVDFSRSIFVGEAVFSGANFARAASFSTTKFKATAMFAESPRPRREGRKGPTVFSGEGGAISQRASELAAQIGASGWLDRMFGEEGAAAFAGEASFSSATFEGMARFANVRFARVADFSEATFEDEARFFQTVFEGKADFTSASFKDIARFQKSTFADQMAFQTALFVRFADFSHVTAPKSEAHWRAAFEGSLLQGALDWRYLPYHMLSALSGATLERGVLLTKVPENVEAKEQRRALREAISAEDRNSALVALEQGALVLKLAMEKTSDKLREQRFYRFELIARRKQRGTSALEQFFSRLYALTADYGASIGTPLGYLIMLVPGWAMGYWAWDASLAGDATEQMHAFARQPLAVDSWSRLWDALSFSTGRVVPFGPWADDEAWLATMDSYGAGWGYGARVAATAQSLAAIILAFLLALAVRRRFQIS